MVGKTISVSRTWLCAESSPSGPTALRCTGPPPGVVLRTFSPPRCQGGSTGDRCLTKACSRGCEERAADDAEALGDTRVKHETPQTTQANRDRAAQRPVQRRTHACSGPGFSPCAYGRKPPHPGSSGSWEPLNLQNVRGQAKPYQVKQLVRLVERYNLQLDEKL